MKPLLLRRLGAAWRAARWAYSGRSAYAAAEVQRLIADWITGIRSADDEIRGDQRRIRARARDVARNVGYVTQYFNLLGANVIGHTGMTFEARVRKADGSLDQEVNKKIEEAWNRWFSGPVTCDGRLDGVNTELLALETLARDGEGFVRLLTDPDAPCATSLQLIDPDLVDHTYSRERSAGKNEIRMGVEVDLLGKPIGYWVSAEPTNSLSYGAGSRYFVPAEEMIHLCRMHRFGQTRGVTWLAPGLYPLKVLDGYEEAELVAARTAAAKMGFLQSKDELAGPAIPNPSAPATATAPKRMEAAPGLIDQLPAGWEFHSWDPQHPTTAHPSFVKTVMRKLACAWGVFYNTLAGDLEGVNYGSMRGGLLIERDLWRIVQQLWIWMFRRRVHRHWLANAMLSGDLVLPSRDYRRYLDHNFTPRGWPWVDPLKDIQALILGLKNGLGSRTRGLAEQGIDFRAILEELEEEIGLARDKEVQISDSAPIVPDNTPAEPANVG